MIPNTLKSTNSELATMLKQSILSTIRGIGQGTELDLSTLEFTVSVDPLQPDGYKLFVRANIQIKEHKKEIPLN